VAECVKLMLAVCIRSDRAPEESALSVRSEE